jgi:hypothetical protein
MTGGLQMQLSLGRESLIPYYELEPTTGIEPVTSSLPRTCSTN